MTERVFGIHAVEALLRNDPARVLRLTVQSERSDARIDAIVALARAVQIPIETQSRKQLDRATHDARHQGVVAETQAAELAGEAEFELRFPTLPTPQLLLALDGVTDPRNLGACLRSADAAGVGAVLLPKSRSAPLSEVARKAASGAAESLFVVSVSNLVRRLEWLKQHDVWVVGASGDGAVAWNAVDLVRPTVLVLGGEGKGLRDLTRKTCDELVWIPMAGAVSSLNVSVATGILLFEAVRQRGGRAG
ncbi:MAG TPA: 23S rRNA (guanosine(2251)-2'-O)-methyltransferase RlmB [Pseudomonadales bacterium]|nr:23S rRNA (guanosine(2251)-2'-O)-methyltransferase RlmB [Pseudomonadales bacterium]